MIKDIVKYTVLGIFLLLALLFRKTIIAIVKNISKKITDLDKKGQSRFSK